MKTVSRAGSSTHKKWGVTHISKDNVREIGYYRFNCIVFLPKQGGTPLTPLLDPALVRNKHEALTAIIYTVRYRHHLNGEYRAVLCQIPFEANKATFTLCGYFYNDVIFAHAHKTLT